MMLLRAAIRRIASRLGFFVKHGLMTVIFADRVAAWEPDVVHCHDLVTLAAGRRVRHRAGARLVYDAHEFERDRMPPMRTLQRRFAAWLEEGARDADAIVTVGDLVARELTDHLSPDRPVAVVHNAPWSQSRCPRDIRSDCGLLADHPLLVHVGVIGAGRGGGFLIRALRRLPGFTLALVGPNRADEIAELTADARSAGVLHQVRFLAPVRPDQVVAYIATADIGVHAIEPLCRSYLYSMPNKLFEMTFAGLPLVISSMPEQASFVEGLGNGITYDAGDEDAFVAAVLRVYADPTRYRLSEAALRDVRNRVGWEAQAAKLVAIYRDLEASLLRSKAAQ